jgi:hypothetical protein
MREKLSPAFVLLTLLAALTSSTCSRPCEDAENCIRKCPCLNENTDQRVDCSIAFRCEGESQTCESAFDSFSCDQICADYAATARCGVARCLSDADCEKTVSCPLVDASGQPTGQFQDCTLNFACELDKGESCEPASSSDDVTLCNICFNGG